MVEYKASSPSPPIHFSTDISVDIDKILDEDEKAIKSTYQRGKAP